MVKAAINLAVENVPASSAWYQSLLNCKSAMEDPTHEHRRLFDLLIDEDGNTLLVLSKWDHNPLEALQRKKDTAPGHGVQLFFSVDDHVVSWEQAIELGATIIEEPHPSRGFETPEFTVRDPDGYTVTVSDFR